MAKLAKPGRRYNRPRPGRLKISIPRLYLLTDQIRLPDPFLLLAHLPRNCAIVVRHKNPRERAALARRLIGPARRLGLKIIIAGDLRLALRCGADGVHLSERMAGRGRLRIQGQKPGFVCTAAAHDRRALWRARQAGADAALLSPVFPTNSHPHAKTVLGVIRFAVLARHSPIPVIALGGVTAHNAGRLQLGPAFGLAAIGAWHI